MKALMLIGVVMQNTAQQATILWGGKPDVSFIICNNERLHWKINHALIHIWNTRKYVLHHLKHVSSTVLWCNDEVDVSLVSQEGRVGDINFQPCIYQVDSLFRSEAIWNVRICPETENKNMWLQINIFVELLVNGIYSLIFLDLCLSQSVITDCDYSIFI